MGDLLSVAVLYGGQSAEREVSLKSGAAVAAALEGLGHRVKLVDVTSALSETLTDLKPDVAFNALHGTFGEDGCVPGLLEVVGLNYTHSGVRASAMAMHKPTTRLVASWHGVPVAEGALVKAAQLAEAEPVARPFVIKPPEEGSSVGVQMVHSGEDIEERLRSYGSEELLLVEEYIPGLELTVGVLNGKALGCLEVTPAEGFYDYTNKYTPGKTDYRQPDMQAGFVQEAMRYAEVMHQALGCRGATRSDFRYDTERDRLVFLEINTHPGLTGTSLLPKQATQAGLDFPALLQALLDAATRDHPYTLLG